MAFLLLHNYTDFICIDKFLSKLIERISMEGEIKL